MIGCDGCDKVSQDIFLNIIFFMHKKLIYDSLRFFSLLLDIYYENNAYISVKHLPIFKRLCYILSQREEALLLHIVPKSRIAIYILSI